VTWGDDGLQLFVDGQLVDSDNYTGGLAGNENPWAIGANAWGSGDNNLDGLSDWFDGQIDDFAIYDRQLSAEEIGTLYNDGVQSMIDADEGGFEYPLSISADHFGGDDRRRRTGRCQSFGGHGQRRRIVDADGRSIGRPDDDHDGRNRRLLADGYRHCHR
jgi:Concanavalin A-like lectin/glucanases superfamily